MSINTIVSNGEHYKPYLPYGDLFMSYCYMLNLSALMPYIELNKPYLRYFDLNKPYLQYVEINKQYLSCVELNKPYLWHIELYDGNQQVILPGCSQLSQETQQPEIHVLYTGPPQPTNHVTHCYANGLITARTVCHNISHNLFVIRVKACCFTYDN